MSEVNTPSPETHVRATDEMVMAGCIAAYGDEFQNWPERSISDGKMMVSKVLRAALVGDQEARQTNLHGLATELLQALCGELRLNRGTHQELINRARAELSTPSPQTNVVWSDMLKDAYLEGWQDASSADVHERDREHAEAGWDFSDAKRSSPEPATNAKTLEEIKYLTLTAGAPNYMPTTDALRRILWLCRQAGVTKTLDELGEYAQGCTTPPQTREMGND